MNIIVACEYSGIVSQAFRDKGHNVVSCDLLPSDVPGSHYQGNIFDLSLDRFDFLIGFPPCPYLSRARSILNSKEPMSFVPRLQASQFFKKLYYSKCPLVALENPPWYDYSLFRKPDQIIQPHYFGSPYKKEICLWLKGLPPLISTCYSNKRKSVSNHVNSRMSQALKSKIKSKFFPEVAEAMANQWDF